MSEYQYYEFRAVDRSLTQYQMGELRAYSSRARISADSFVNFYEWGDFKGDPDKWMEKYFDAFLYLANWGTRQLMLRVPKRLLDSKTAQEYCSDESLTFRTKGDHLILSFNSQEEDSEWDDGEGWLASLLQLRSDLMHGDYRCLYLGWLLGVQAGEFDDDDLEPPLPAALGSLNGPLQRLADFLRIDRDLIAAAAQKSKKEPAGDLSPEEIFQWVASLPSKEKDTVLIRLIGGDDSHLAAELKRRASCEIRGERKSDAGIQKSDRRSVGQILARSESIGDQRRNREAERQALERDQRERAQAEARKRHLESLAGEEGAAWKRIDRLIATKQPKRYDEAVLLLKDLQDVADMKGTAPDFARRMSALCQEHTKKPSLLDRLRKAKLTV